MWTDITNKSRVQLVWQEVLHKGNVHGPRFRAELTVVKLDTAKAGDVGSVYVIYHTIKAEDTGRMVDDCADTEFVSVLRDNLIKMNQYGPHLHTVAGDEPYVTRHFGNISDGWFKLVQGLAERIYAKEQD